MKRVCSVLFAGLLTGVGACSFLSAHEHHKGPSTGVESLDVVAADGKIHLLVGEWLPAGPALSYQVSGDGGENWSKPVRVDAGSPPPGGLMRGMDAQIAAKGDHLVAVWETAGTDAWGGGPMATALSEDGGKTWQPGPKPADDGLTTGHGFIDIAAAPSGAFHLVWLDSRTGKQGLRYARSDDNGKRWQPNVTIDPDPCECCWNVIAPGGKNLYALYRARSPRDMALGVSTDAGQTWSRRSSVGAFGWKIEACPHAGGGLVSLGQALHAVVWTGKSGETGVYYLRSEDAGKNWLPPHLLGEKGAQHADIAALPDGHLAAVWDSHAGESAIYAKTSADGGLVWSRAQRLSAPGAHAGFPRVVAAGPGFRVFWTQYTPGSDPVWKSAALPAGS